MSSKIYSKDKTALILVDIQKPFFTDADSSIREEFPKFKVFESLLKKIIFNKKQ